MYEQGKNAFHVNLKSKLERLPLFSSHASLLKLELFIESQVLISGHVLAFFFAIWKDQREQSRPQNDLMMNMYCPIKIQEVKKVLTSRNVTEGTTELKLGRKSTFAYDSFRCLFLLNKH